MYHGLHYTVIKIQGYIIKRFLYKELNMFIFAVNSL